MKELVAFAILMLAAIGGITGAASAIAAGIMMIVRRMG